MHTNAISKSNNWYHMETQVVREEDNWCLDRLIRDYIDLILKGPIGEFIDFIFKILVLQRWKQ